MADGHGQRIGGVVRRRRGGQTEEQLHHHLHLRLLGAAVADDGALHFGGRVFHHFAPGLDRGEHGHAAGVPQLQGAAGVDRVKEVFDGDAVGARGGQEARELAVDPGQPLGQRVTGRRRDGAAGNEPVAPTVGLDAPIAGALGAGVDAEDPHASEASISFSSMSKFAHTRWTSSWSSSISISLSIVRASLPSSLM